jgi:hypothetical protein
LLGKPLGSIGKGDGERIGGGAHAAIHIERINLRKSFAFDKLIQ